MQQDYYAKYLKYKNKYLELKSQMGGDKNILLNQYCEEKSTILQSDGKSPINHTVKNCNEKQYTVLTNLFKEFDTFELEQKDQEYILYGVNKTCKTIIATTKEKDKSFKNAATSLEFESNDAASENITVYLTVKLKEKEKYKTVTIILYFRNIFVKIYNSFLKPTEYKKYIMPDAAYATSGPPPSSRVVANTTYTSSGTSGTSGPTPSSGVIANTTYASSGPVAGSSLGVIANTTYASSRQNQYEPVGSGVSNRTNPQPPQPPSLDKLNELARAREAAAQSLPQAASNPLYGTSQQRQAAQAASNPLYGTPGQRQAAQAATNPMYGTNQNPTSSELSEADEAAGYITVREAKSL